MPTTHSSGATAESDEQFSEILASLDNIQSLQELEMQLLRLLLTRAAGDAGDRDSGTRVPDVRVARQAA